jgi:two-component system LytT family response regulator
MTVRVVVVDDEKPARDRVRRLLRDHPDFELVGEAADVASAIQLIDRERPDLCLLDVRVPGGDGFQVLERVEHVPRVVLTTAFDEYAVRAFEVDSTDYLLKPFRADRFAAALARVRAEIARDEVAATEPDRGPPAPVPGRRGARIVLLDPRDVLWFEAEETLVFAWTAEGRVLVDRTLAELETQMGSTFFRAHRAYLVNLARIGEIAPVEGGTYRLVLKDPERTALPLSRRQARRLREKLRW